MEEMGEGYIYRPQTKLGKGNVFNKSVSRILCTGEEVYTHPRQIPPADGYRRGQYASYWNAFLFLMHVVCDYRYGKKIYTN